MEKNKEKLPAGVRAIIYSYLAMTDLIHLISKVSRNERELMFTSPIISQKRCLKVRTDCNEKIKI